MRYQVDVAFNERTLDTLFVDADDRDQAEYDAINRIRDTHDIGLSDVEILEVTELNG